MYVEDILGNITKVRETTIHLKWYDKTVGVKGIIPRIGSSTSRQCSAPPTDYIFSFNSTVEFDAFVDLLLEARAKLGVPGTYSDPNLTEFIRHNIDTVCNPGDKCYEIVGSKIKEYTIDHFTAYKDKNIQKVQACLVNNDGLFDLRSVDDFGRTLYLTKKEADFKLNGWDRDNNFDELTDTSGNSSKIQNRLFRRIAAVICSNKMRAKKK